MDVLQKYNSEIESKHASTPAVLPAELMHTGFIVRLIIKLSGGRIRDERQIRIIMLVVAGFFFLVAIAVFSLGREPGGRYISPEDDRTLTDFP